jgi:GNAT superfamily N-acetyltransferase
MTALPTSETLTLRPARADDLAAIEALIARSARGLSAGFYSEAQVAALLEHVFGADTQLVRDGTYYLVEAPSAGLAAVGGWSRRRTLYGGDRMKGAEDPLLDPAREAARLRAFFVHPDWARRGLGRRLYRQCEAAAWAEGFRRLTLVATLPGEPLYRALGFGLDERFALDLPAGVQVPVARMSRPIVLPAAAGAEA